MNDAFPLAPLGDVLDKSTEQIALEPTEQYKQVTVRLWGKGVTLRDEVTGAEIVAEKRYIVRAGQFILSRIDARNGAFGIVPNALDGAVVSTDFPVFNVNAKRMDPAFLGWMSKTAAFVDLCKAASEGTTNRVRLKEDKFLVMQIPLPPLAEQRRIVARIEALATRIAEARGLRRQVRGETEAFWTSVLRSVFVNDSMPCMTLETACSAIIDNLHSTPTYDGIDFPCIRSQDVGWGTINYSTALMTSESEFCHRTQRGEPQEGDIVYVREGDVGRCALVDGSRRFSLGQRVMMLRPDHDVIEPRYLTHQLLSPVVLDDQVRNNKTGTTSHHVNIKHLRQIRLSVPSMIEQRRIVEYLDAVQSKVDAMKQVQAETAAELDALLPAVLHRAFRGEL